MVLGLSLVGAGLPLRMTEKEENGSECQYQELDEFWANWFWGVLSLAVLTTQTV